MIKKIYLFYTQIISDVSDDDECTMCNITLPMSLQVNITLEKSEKYQGRLV